MATFNGMRFLPEQIETILNQTRSVDEIVVCDDCSQDETWAYLSRLARNERRLRIFRNERNMGSTLSFSRSLSCCHGDIVFLSDQDDCWHSNKVERMQSIMEASDALIVMSDGDLIDQDGTHICGTLWQRNALTEQVRTALGTERGVELALTRPFLTGSAICVRKKLLDIALPIPDGVQHDIWLTWRATLVGSGAIEFLPESLYGYRQHAGNQIGALSRTGYQFFSKAAIARILKEIRTDMQIRSALASYREFQIVLERTGHADGVRLSRTIEKILDHLQFRMAFVHGEIPFALIFSRKCLDEYKIMANGWKTAMGDILRRFFMETR